jgi:hypothetical protein
MATCNDVYVEEMENRVIARDAVHIGQQRMRDMEMRAYGSIVVDAAMNDTTMKIARTAMHHGFKSSEM